MSLLLAAPCPHCGAPLYVWDYPFPSDVAGAAVVIILSLALAFFLIVATLKLWKL